MRVSLAAVLLFTGAASAFAPSQKDAVVNSQLFSSTKDLATAKAELLGLLGRQTSQIEGVADPVLADPETKEPIRVTSSGTIFGDGYGKTKQSLTIRSPTNEFEGSSNTYINLLEPKAEKKTEEDADILKLAARQLTPFIPPPLRAAVAASGLDADGYVPMRDLFTSPAVSFAYERGWRQGFQQAGFPGPDKEFEMAKEYFAPALADSSTLVDMSCATGLFTRRFAGEDRYDRVLGCDYSDSMLTEARRRISADSVLSELKNTRLELVRLDVGKIPMREGSVDALHAGAAMHCWPDLEAAMKEIYRVLKPGGRYFATTFLAQYFSTLQGVDGASSPSQQAFQYFSSVEQLRKLVEAGGFESEKVQIEVLGAACVVIRAEK